MKYLLILFSVLFISGCTTAKKRGSIETMSQQKIGKGLYSIAYETDRRVTKNMVANFVSRKAKLLCFIKYGTSTNILSMNVERLGGLFSSRVIFRCGELGER